MRYALYVIAAMFALNAVITIATVGKQRKPTTPGAAAVVMLINAAEVVVLILAAGHLT